MFHACALTVQAAALEEHRWAELLYRVGVRKFKDLKPPRRHPILDLVL